MSAGNAVFIAMGGFGIGFDLVSTRNARGSRLPWFTARSNDTKDAPAASTNPFFNANRLLVWLPVIRKADRSFSGSSPSSLNMTSGYAKLLAE